MDAAEPDTRVSFALLGPLEVRHDGAPLEIGGRRLRALLASLLLSPGRMVPFEMLVSGVWDVDPPSGVGNALQALVSRLRAAVGRDLVAAETSGYRLVISPDQVDVHRFVRLVADGRAALARGESGEAASTLRDALALWRGPAFADLSGVGAAEAEIARLEGLRLAAIEERIDADLRLGRHAEVLADLPALIAAHPLRERPHGLLMRALYASGRRVEALAAYQVARETFADRLGTGPSPALAELHLSMLRDDDPSMFRDHRPAVGAGTAPRPAVVAEPSAATRPPVAPEPPAAAASEDMPQVAAVRRGNLRARLTSFVGREKDLERAGELLARHRLVTMLGPGGAGKTRLAVESGEALAGRMPEGVWLAELAPVREAEDVPQAVLAALGIRDTGRAPVRTQGLATAEAGDPTTRLVAGLRSSRRLIILDNCEHLVEAAARLADRILAECPEVRILATSREPLGITGELLWPVQPLAQEHAQSLFADRAATARPGYVLDGDAGAVARICRELDGMPLAIELAAARLRTLSAGQIADRLDDRFRLLTGGSRTALPRHQTLRAVVEWSWDLLDQRERVLARRLAAFAGGATLEAVETVCSDDALPREEVLDLLARLVDKSLVVYENQRYRMLETIRAYATERLVESGEEHPVRLAHARFFTHLAETAEPELRRAEQVKWLAALSAEHDNLTAALRCAVGSADLALGLRLVGALGWYWFLMGRRAEGAQRAAEVIALTGDAVDVGQRDLALALTVHGILMAGGTDQWQESKEVLGTALRLARSSVPRPWPPMISLAEPVLTLFLDVAPDPGRFMAELFDDPDRWVVACAHLLRAHIHYNAGQIAKGEADVRASLEHYRAVGDRWGISTAMAALAEVSTLRGDNATTIAVIKEALELVDEIGAVEDTPYMRSRLAMALHASGDPAGADAVLDEALDICRTAADRMGESGVHIVRGDFARENGDLRLARRDYERALNLASEEMTSPAHFRAMLRSSLGLLAEQEGDLEAARDAHAEALRLARDTHDGSALGLVLIALAGLVVLEGDAAAAAMLLGGAARLRGVDDVVGYDHVRITDATMAALGREEYSRCFERGRSLPHPRLLTLAREHSTMTRARPSAVPDPPSTGRN
ncbi:AfsR/SARP family transcriptional regulator [Sphaerisporangium perillae]|uniref:AfsR/SARP family transcriptional regulator n=1 Tax=Sphaerisporangium perillae TaxID=2935860 RepID=UPI00200D15C4|nr:BTAD domain-containing putative transcriptional regulator [Sphaerisporangium perillae]